jgi:NAD(P)-dependent dehydrogenase (short-subunit alcohol dehydrogenase family)
VLPEMRERRDGLLVWVGPAAPDGALPCLGPFFAARAAADHLARSYAVELASFGIETSIVTAGARVSGDASLIYPVDAETMAAYQDLLPGPLDQADRRLARLTPDATSAAGAVVTLVDTPKGGRPFSVIVEPAGGASFRKHPDSYRYHGPGDSPASRDEE